MLIWVLIFISLLVAVFILPKDRTVSVTSLFSPSITVSSSKIITPIADFRSRITKKSFGAYVTPQNSPVSPERFTGYHTGVDVEYGDVAGDVPVAAVAPGEIVVSRFASGYGGVIMIKHQISSQTYYGVYGHLRLRDMLPSGTSVRPGQTIGFLGDGYSRDTDNERRHLHFGLALTDSLLGYVQDKSELDGWVDPLTIIPQ